MHSVLCNVGLPRSRTPERVFERRSGLVSVRLEVGSLFNGQEFIEQELPYGVLPRLLLMHIGTEAIRTRQRRIDLGRTERALLKTLRMTCSGGKRGGYASLRRQLRSLGACRLTLGVNHNGRAVTVDAKPVQRFELWTAPSQGCPAAIELSQPFFQSLLTHAVPLDMDAIASLRSSALALDLYAWLAHRLCRIRSSMGVKVSWQNLREQFGQEYTCPRNFKRVIRAELPRVLAVYPKARVERTPGGLLLRSSIPPIQRLTSIFSAPAEVVRR